MNKKEKPQEITLDILMIRDQQYFRQHPSQNSYIREYVPGEFDFPPNIILFNEKGKELKYVLVQQIHPELRTRSPLFGELDKILSKHGG